MNVLVDYHCADCAVTFERWVPRPIAGQVACARCGLAARRVFGGQVARGAREAPRAAAGASGEAGFIRKNFDVPGICHMDASSARRWAAMARNDQRAVDAEVRRQEQAVSACLAPPAPH